MERDEPGAGLDKAGKGDLLVGREGSSGGVNDEDVVVEGEWLSIDESLEPDGAACTEPGGSPVAWKLRLPAIKSWWMSSPPTITSAVGNALI